MNISGVRPSASFYSYNSIKINELRNQQISAAKEATNTNEEPQVEENSYISSAAPQQNFNSYDYAQRYNPEESFELKGVNSDIRKLDVQKAVSELEKDAVIKQYQYFVGNKPTEIATTVAEVSSQSPLRSGENFML